jgi:mono/diheme cytochrome c family protein
MEKCEPCHGASGQGDGPRAQDLPNPVTAIGSPDVARGVPPVNWFTIVSQGNLERMMPPFASLTDRQRWDVVAFVFSLSTPRSALAQGAELYQENCAQCHGKRGKGDGSEAGTLAMPDFSRQETMAVKSASDFFKAISEGVLPGMPAFSDQLNEDERWALAGYIRSLSFSPQVAEEPGITPVPSQPTSFPLTTPLTPTEIVSGTNELGVVTGVVMNASGGSIPPEQSVTLHAFDEMQIVYTTTTGINADGTYTFDQVQIKPGWRFLTTIEFDGMVYGSDLFTADQVNAGMELPIRIFETTSDASTLSIDRLHYFFEFVDEQTIRVVELYIISNSSQKTVVAPGDGQPVVNFPLPAGAVDLEFQEGELGGRYIKTDAGFGDTTPIQPGSGVYQVLFAYKMPYERKLELHRPMPLDATAIVILVPEENFKVKGDGIEDAGSRDVQGVQYHMFNRGSLKKGSDLSLTVTGRPSETSSELVLSSAKNLVVGLGALGIVLILGGLWMYRRSKPPKPAESVTPSPASQHEETTEAIMDSILTLDDLYQEGKLPEEAYLQRRGELKSRLREKMEKQG